MDSLLNKLQGTLDKALGSKEFQALPDAQKQMITGFANQTKNISGNIDSASMERILNLTKEVENYKANGNK